MTMERRRLTKSAAGAALTASAAAWTSCGVLAVGDVHRVQRFGLLPSPWVLLLFAAGALALVAATRPSTPTVLPLFLSAAALLPWLPLPVPDLFLLWTGPCVALLWIAVAVLVAVRAVAWRPPPRPALAAALAFAAFVAARSVQRESPTGDEPHYLVLAQSLLLDRDVKVGNNYARGDYRSYYGGPLEPHVVRSRVDGEAYSIHAVGISVLVAPAFAVGGLKGAAIWIAALAAIGAAFVWSAAFALTGDAAAAWFAWAAVVLTSPGLLHGALIYPDPVAGMLLSGGVLALGLANTRGTAAPPWPTWSSFALGLAIGALPWLHTRLILPAVILGSLLLVHLARDRAFGASRRRHIAAFAAPFVVVVLLWPLFSWETFGTLNPVAPYGDRVPLEARYAASGLLGLLFDQQFGLVANAPVHLVSLMGLVSLWKMRRRLAVELLLLVVPYAVASAAYPMWWGGASPPARFLVPVVFPLGIAAAAGWASQDARGRAVSATLLLISIVMAIALAAGADGTLAYNLTTGRARWIDWAFPLLDVPSGLPSFFRGTPSGGVPATPIVRELAVPALFWIAALAGAWRVLGGHAGPPLRSDTGPPRVPWDTGSSRAPWDAGPPRAPWDPGPPRAPWDAGPPRVAWGAGPRVPFRATVGVLLTRATAGVLLTPAVLAAAGVLAFFATRAISDRGAAPIVTPTRAQLDLLRSADANARPFGVRLLPPRILTTSDVSKRLTIESSPIDPPRDGDLLLLREVPPGEYVVRAANPPGARGELSLGIGRGSAPAAVWPVAAAAADYPFSLPVRASILTIHGSEPTPSLRDVALVRVAATKMPLDGRARDAVRYGSAVVYALDERVSLEPPGFWVFGERRPQVVIATHRPDGAVDVTIRNGAAANRAVVRLDRSVGERALAPGETWRLALALPRGAALVGFESSSGFRPADVDRSSRDRRWLGFWVEVR